ncbi:MAG: aminopeptidase [Boseongicola sp. SB0662_bin_57]|nr:aminopeptidase [Boseongicola sp. SB0662_bin_57]
MPDNLPFDVSQLDRLAETIVSTGVNLAEGQNLLITASAEALPLVRRVTERAYRNGGGLVTPILKDEDVTRARYRYGRPESLDQAPDWLYQGMAEAYGNNTARLHIAAENPMALASENPESVARAARANAEAFRPALEKISGFEINWSIAAYPGRAWAKLVFPDLDEGEAQAELAKAIFSASRTDQDDPVAAWAAHNAVLAARRDWLNGMEFAALHFRSSGTDVTVGLADGHCWMGGASEARNGIVCNPNIPSEEVFTVPHKDRVDGIVRATKPLAYQGTLIKDIEVRFEEGRVVEANASSNEEVFRKLLESDEGARRIGEVALVPYASPISESGILFYNTLFDENAACHVALGQCYKDCLHDSDGASEDEIAGRGGNSSIVHVDWMIGAKDTDIDGITATGGRVAVFRDGNWAI